MKRRSLLRMLGLAPLAAAASQPAAKSPPSPRADLEINGELRITGAINRQAGGFVMTRIVNEDGQSITTTALFSR